MPHLAHHGVARGDAMGPAQFLRLIDADPQDTEGNVTAREVIKLHLKPFLKIGAARLQIFCAAAVFTERQCVEGLSGMECNCCADALAKTVSQNDAARNCLHFVSELMADMNNRSARWRLT